MNHYSRLTSNALVLHFLYNSPAKLCRLGGLYGRFLFAPSWGFCSWPKRSIIYIDGFNLYYGAIQRTAYKWLDLERYFSLVRQDDDIQAINYFTAVVQTPNRVSQNVYLQALSTCPLVSVILGKYKKTERRCHVPGCTYPGRREFKSWEEKRTDVNIALQMLDDAIHDRCERMVVVSGDSDLVPALERVKNFRPAVTITVYVPARNRIRGAAVELRAAADKARTLPLAPLGRSQFPPTLMVGTGSTINKPVGW